MELSSILCLQTNLKHSVKLVTLKQDDKMIATFLKASFKSTPSKNIVYRQGRNYESIS